MQHKTISFIWTMVQPFRAAPLKSDGARNELRTRWPPGRRNRNSIPYRRFRGASEGRLWTLAEGSLVGKRKSVKNVKGL
jgi:hypothetical protein